MTHACTTANASVNYSRYVPQRPSKVPIAPMGFSHVLRFVLAGRRCVHRRWHGELLIVRHHWQHSCFCACSCSKVPIAPMGFSHVCARLCLQGGVYIGGGTVSFSSCTITGNTAVGVRAHAQYFPSPRWEKWLTCLPRLSLAQLQPTLWSTTGCACPRDLEKFPWPRWENALP